MTDTHNRGRRRTKTEREIKQEGEKVKVIVREAAVTERERETEGERERQPVSAAISQADRRVTFTVIHCAPVSGGLNETRPYSSSMLSPVSSSSAITLHLLNRHQTYSHGPWRLRGGRGLPTAKRPLRAVTSITTGLKDSCPPSR